MTEPRDPLVNLLEVMCGHMGEAVASGEPIVAVSVVRDAGMSRATAYRQHPEALRIIALWNEMRRSLQKQMDAEALQFRARLELEVERSNSLSAQVVVLHLRDAFAINRPEAATPRVEATADAVTSLDSARRKRRR